MRVTRAPTVEVGVGGGGAYERSQHPQRVATQVADLIFRSEGALSMVSRTMFQVAGLALAASGTQRTPAVICALPAWGGAVPARVPKSPAALATSRS